MAEISRFFAYRHLRSEAASHVVVVRRGKLVRSGRGLSFWFDPDHTSIMEIAADDRDTGGFFPSTCGPGGCARTRWTASPAC